MNGDLEAFELSGVVDDGTPVTARWSAGGLLCDPALAVRARMLVDLGETFGGDRGTMSYGATLDGPPVAVALTLIRACCTVTQLVVSIDGAPATVRVSVTEGLVTDRPD
jgi:hypothetical protein